MYSKIKVAAASPQIKVADPISNATSILGIINNAAIFGASILLTPELSLSAYTCQDLFYNKSLANASQKALISLLSATQNIDMYIIVGLPVFSCDRVYNCSVCIYKGKIVNVSVKHTMTSYTHERAFTYSQINSIDINGQTYNISDNFTIYDSVSVQVNVGKATNKLDTDAKIVLNPFSLPSPADTHYFTTFVPKNKAQIPVILLSNASCTESTTDYVFSGQCMIVTEDTALASKRYEIGGSYIISEVNLPAKKVKTSIAIPETVVETIKRCPYMPDDSATRAKYIEDILEIQATGILKRMMFIGTKKAVLGISGGLDSTLSLLALVRAFDKAGYDKTGITAITMPGFGTSHTTKNNAVDLIDALGVTKKEISIKDACINHFKDIGHDGRPDTAYENAQARERTQILMDYSNMTGSLMVGTGDLSEIALGFATYNGDHIAMYSPNGSIPKTVIRLIVDHIAENSDEKLKQVLKDILDTPVSPELVNSADNKQITQKTEEIVGPYELHDFFIYYFIRGHMTPSEILQEAVKVFPEYSEDKLKSYLKIFVKRFFAGQFKRSCSPDGAMATLLSLSPRGGLFMPSDANPDAFLDF